MSGYNRPQVLINQFAEQFEICLLIGWYSWCSADWMLQERCKALVYTEWQAHEDIISIEFT